MTSSARDRSSPTPQSWKWCRCCSCWPSAGGSPSRNHQQHSKAERGSRGPSSLLAAGAIVGLGVATLGQPLATHGIELSGVVAYAIGIDPAVVEVEQRADVDG